MKIRKILSITIIIILCLCLIACGRQNRYSTSSIPSDYGQADFSDKVTIVSDEATPAVSTAAPEVVPTPTPTVAPVTVSATPKATSNVTATTGDVNITKSPTGETVTVGGKASFVAYADNSTSTNWILVSPDAKTSYKASEAATVFSGLVVQGETSSTLILTNIPASMDGWRIQAYFTGQGGPKYTNGAYLKVTTATATPSPTPTDATAAKALDLANTAYSDAKTAGIAAGYTVGAMADYIYHNSMGDFNVLFSKTDYNVVVEFYTYPSSSSSSPATATIINNSTKDMKSVDCSSWTTLAAILASPSSY